MRVIANLDVSIFQWRLLRWYKNNGRNFPWRKRKLTRYQLIIAEALLQRTKAETVAKFYRSFVTKYPNWVSLAKARRRDIETALKPIGLHRQRSRRLKDLALEMVRRNGRLPEKREQLESIPFLGQYLTNAVMLVIFNKRLPLVDVNMSRVLERYFGKRKLADIRYDPYLQNLATRVVNSTNSMELNWAILDFAALVCKARSPLCNACALKSGCRFFRKRKSD